jgi:hypothetical protein
MAYVIQRQPSIEIIRSRSVKRKKKEGDQRKTMGEGEK